MKSRIDITYVPTAKLWYKVSTSAGENDSEFGIYYCEKSLIDLAGKYAADNHEMPDGWKDIYSCATRYAIHREDALKNESVIKAKGSAEKLKQ